MGDFFVPPIEDPWLGAGNRTYSNLPGAPEMWGTPYSRTSLSTKRFEEKSLI